MFGRPGSGKSSLAGRLGSVYGYALIRTGELLREAVRRRDPLGLQVEPLLKQGQLVPDPLIFALLDQTLQAPGTTTRLLFDGFPRTIGQVALLEQLEASRGFQIDAFLEIWVRREVAIERMTGRRICPVCGATYHVVTNPPRVPETCDLDGSRLERRPDDDPAVIAIRQQVYDDHALPILDHYRTHAPDRFRRVNGEQPIDAVYAETCRALDLTG
jgi:adenylate kinase